jgi:hypothetical protein
VVLSSDGTTVTTDIGRDICNEDFVACPTVQYIRNRAIVTVHKRLTMQPSSFDAYEIFTGTRSSTPDNNLNSDVEIYDDYSEMLASGARWNYCNHDYTNIGFPFREIGVATIENVTGPGGHDILIDIQAEAFNIVFAACPIVQYTRNNAIVAIYKHLTITPATFDACRVSTSSWKNQLHILNTKTNGSHIRSAVGCPILPENSTARIMAPSPNLWYAIPQTFDSFDVNDASETCSKDPLMRLEDSSGNLLMKEYNSTRAGCNDLCPGIYHSFTEPCQVYELRLGCYGQKDYDGQVHITASPIGIPSNQSSRQPSMQPSQQPSSLPSSQSTSRPSIQRSTQPSTQMSTQPSAQPSMQPSSQPSASAQPSGQPTSRSSTQPSRQPSGQPTCQPSSQSSHQPASQPSTQPSMQPSSQPSCQPSCRPSGRPTCQPSSQPSHQPAQQPSMQPCTQPTIQPTRHPSFQPSTQPPGQPSKQPWMQPSSQPTSQPSMQSNGQPSGRPSGRHTCQPTSQPSDQPSQQPSMQPSRQPSAIPTMQLSCFHLLAT